MSTSKSDLKPEEIEEWVEDGSPSTEKAELPRLKYDKHGLPLSPQPSDDPQEYVYVVYIHAKDLITPYSPLNWSLAFKVGSYLYYFAYP